MEDDEEVQSQPSEGTRSPSSPRSNGRITVTVAAAPPPQTTNTLTLALPIQQQSKTSGGGGGGGGGGSGGREDCWSEGATAVLIDAWGERYLELSRGNLKQQHWKDVADIVSSREDYTKPPKTDIQCKNRIDTVKKKYKLEKAKIAAGQGPSRWTFFEKLDHLIGPAAKNSSGGFAGTSAGNQKVPMGIPMGARSAPQLRQHQPPSQLQQKQKQGFRKRPPADSDTSESEPEPSPDSSDSSPPPTYEKKRPRIQQREVMNSSAARPTIPRGTVAGGSGGSERDRNWANSVRELTRSILKFGEAYEQAENAKLQQMVEIEKQRMKFAKEMELQRMQFFMKTQLELSQLKNQRVGSGNHHCNNNNTTANNNNTTSYSSN